MSSESEKPRIIIDEDWKAQAQREKEELERQESQRRAAATTGPTMAASGPATTASGPAGAASSAGPANQPTAGPADASFPPATFETLVSLLATEAYSALGLLADPRQGRPEPRLDVARHMIDLLGVLESKTQGNLSPQESRGLGELLHELRLIFVEVQRGES